MLLGSCSQPVEQRAATVAVAANFKTTLDLLEADFEANTPHEINAVVGSTGKLYAQIVYGAPFDVFLAADQARPERLEGEQRAVADTRFTYALGRLAVIGIDEPGQLSTSDVAHIAIANPDLAPYGKAAKQVVVALGLSETIDPKLVLGENVGQAFAFVQTGNAQAGFVSEAQIRALQDLRAIRTWHPDPSLHAPIAQDAVLLNRATDSPAALAFLEYLQSEPARDIISKQGYDLP